MSLVKSGKVGKITIGSSDIAEVRNWKFTMNSNNKQYASSTTAGHQKTVCGVKGGSVSFSVYLDVEDPIEDRIKPGDLVTLQLYRDTVRYYSVPARIESLDEDVNIEDGEIPMIGVEAMTDGPWTYVSGDVSSIGIS